MASGAVCFNLLQAAYSLGYSAQWLSDWFSFDEPSKLFMGIEADEQVAGFIYIGTAPDKKPTNRPTAARCASTNHDLVGKLIC